MEAFGVLFFLVGWPFLAILCGVAARSRGRSFILWFLFSLIFSPLLGVLFLLVFPPRRSRIR